MLNSDPRRIITPLVLVGLGLGVGEGLGLSNQVAISTMGVIQPQIRKSWDSMENANKKRK